METTLPEDWRPWRAPSPLGGHRPGREDLALAASSGLGRQDVLPYPADAACAGHLRLLVVGINPGLWTAAVNAPFARPGNRFWPSLHLAGLTSTLVDASRGLSAADEQMLAESGVGVINLVQRATARADELTEEELRGGAQRLVQRVRVLRPRLVAVAGVTAFRTAFAAPRAALGRYPVATVAGWPDDVPLWVLPNPSGLNAHETVQTLAQRWQEVWAASAR
ncbi:mismatch-specific DNA-glycosylase [Ruania albidiflava]|uniref:mismatch-specific DNA-glycosylase n=1 Tax=Ruania albidiflava TaxID=366586 RepID=UPI0023F36107|nr:mismatch-specific DNA-glycosylase [Ruania albidiflava]